MKLKHIVTALAVYLFSAGGSLAGFYFFTPAPEPLISPAAPDETYGQGFIIPVDPQAPKNEPCPLNGELFTKTEREVWEKRRPLLVMIENHHEARPQSGLSFADVVYEAVAEGGITRFLAVYYCDAIDRDNILGPVRSARTYYLDWASEYSDHPLYIHVGGANTPGKANALGQIGDYGWAGENDLNQFALSVKECWRDYTRIGHQVATEHTMYCSTEALWKKAADRGWEAEGEDGELWSDQFTAWKFADPKPIDSPKATDITFDFWEDFSQYRVNWKYDSITNKYLRRNWDQPHLDLDTQSQLAIQVVVVQEVKETGPIDDLKHLLYGTTGKGNATIFQNGDVVVATWTKKDRTSRTVFTDPRGREIQFARGKIWIEAVPTGTKITY